MAVQFLDLTASFVHTSSSLAFGTFSSDSDFQSDADGMVKYTFTKLGGNVLQVELTHQDVYQSLEEAALEYSSLVNTWQAKSELADILGGTTGSMTGQQNRVARLSLSLAKRKAQAFSSEIGLGGTKTLYSSSVSLNSGQQAYDLKVLLSASDLVASGSRVEIKDIFHFSPTATYRFFDTSSAINYLHNEFKFESFTPETVFYLLPVWEDVLRGQSLHTSHTVRRSNYSYDVINNVVRIYPVPTTAAKLFFTYYLSDENPWDVNDPWVNGIANISNVPFGAITYAKVNSLGKQWIRRMSFALSKEILGLNRSKVGNVPIPNGEMILNGNDLVMQAREEQVNLREELKNLLEETTYQNLALKDAEMNEALKNTLARAPLGIFVGIFPLFLLLSEKLIK